MTEIEYKISKILQEEQPITESEAQDLAHLICEFPEIKAAGNKRKLVISIEDDVILFDNLEDFKLHEFMGILHNAMSTKQPTENANCAIFDVSISLPSDEEIREPIENALYSTDRLTTYQCTELADGILTYLNESGFKVVRQ